MDEGLWHPEASPEPSHRGKVDLGAIWGVGSLMSWVSAWSQGLSLQCLLAAREKIVTTQRSIRKGFDRVMAINL